MSKMKNERYLRYLSNMSLDVRSDTSVSEADFLDNILKDVNRKETINKYLCANLRYWIRDLFRMLDRIGREGRGPHGRVNDNAAEACARAMMSPNIELLQVEWGSKDSNAAMEYLKKRIEGVLAAYPLAPLPKLSSTYSMISIHKSEAPVHSERTPSICLFPFYKVQGRRPYWSIFEFGKQQHLGLIMNDATSRSLRDEQDEQVKPAPDENTIGRKRLLDWVIARSEEIKKYNRNMFLHFGKGYAAVEIFEAMLEEQAGEERRFGRDKLLDSLNPMLVGLTEALKFREPAKNDDKPAKNDDKPAMPIVHKKEIVGLLSEQSGTRLTLITDPGESIYNSLREKNYENSFIFYRLNHGITVQVGLGFSLGMVPWFLRFPDIVGELADEIYNFLN